MAQFSFSLYSSSSTYNLSEWAKKKKREYLIGLMNGHEWINGRIVDTWPANEEFINISPKMLSLYSGFWNANPPNIPLIWRCAFVFLIHRAAVIWIFFSLIPSDSNSMNSQKGFYFRFWLINTHVSKWNEIVLKHSIRLGWMVALSNNKPVYGFAAWQFRSLAKYIYFEFFISSN